jgi:predicted TIM-barrel fold metal-dependent hydrolase
MIDVHIHLSPPEMVADRSSFIKGEVGLQALYTDPAAKLAGPDELLEVLDQSGVEKALVMGFPYGSEEKAKRHNDFILSECARRPQRLYPLAAFDPRARWALKHAEQFLQAGGCGLGELCVYDEGLTPPLLDNLEALGDICKKHGAPLLMHVNEPIGHQYPGKAPMEISQIFELVKRCQGVKLILAHFGGGLPFFSSLKKGVSEFLSLVRFDTAAMPFLFEPKALRTAVDLMGPSFFFLGTDFPLLKPARYLKYFQAAGLTPEETGLVSGEAAAAFLGL